MIGTNELDEDFTEPVKTRRESPQTRLKIARDGPGGLNRSTRWVDALLGWFVVNELGRRAVDDVGPGGLNRSSRWVDALLGWLVVNEPGRRAVDDVTALIWLNTDPHTRSLQEVSKL